MIELVPGEGGFFGAFNLFGQPTRAVVAVGGAGRGFGQLVQGIEGVSGAADFGAVAGGIVAIARRAFARRIEFAKTIQRVIGVAGGGFEALVGPARDVAGRVVG